VVEFDHSVARRLDMSYEEAVTLADDCARHGLVMHHQS
jgi:hypothetical protein